MDLLETLSLAMALEVNLELVNDQIKTSPGKNSTDELREAIRANLEALKQHLEDVEESWQYKLLTDIAVAGITLRLKPDGQLYASPREKVLESGLRDRIKENKEFFIDHLILSDRLIRHESEVTLLARSKFDMEPFEPVPSVAEAWTDPDKAAFFKRSWGA